MKRFYTLFILFFFTSSLFAQIVTVNQGKTKQKNYLQEIPYKKIKGIPVVQISINGKMYNFFFDTGAPLCISDKIFKELNLPVLNQKNMGSASGEYKKMRYISLPELHLQGITFLNTFGTVFHEDEWFECLGIDGIIGSNMLSNFIVHFDEQNGHIIITDNINELSLKKKVHQKMTLSKIQSIPFITITIRKGKNRAVNNVMFDSGQSSFFEISTSRFPNYAVDKIAEGEGRLGYGIHGLSGKQSHTLQNLPKLEFNRVKFNDVVVTTTHGNSSRIGAKLLEYGKTTLDYKKKRFYFEPYENINTSELSEISWAIHLTIQNNKMVVGIIWDKELKSQINVEDEVLSINGIAFQSMDFCELFMFEISKRDTQILELRDIHTNKIKKVEIKRLKCNRIN